MNANEDALYSIVLRLTPTRRASVRATMGHQAHAAFLRTVEESDPALADVLHMPDMPTRPFTVSMLNGTPPPEGGRLHLSPEETYWLRFTVLYPPIFEQFMNRFLSGRGRPVIRLGRAVLLIKEILTTPESHPWAGYTSWADLAMGAEAKEDVALTFASPTAFSFGQMEWGKKIMVLPLPEIVFSSLSRGWNLLAPSALQIDRRALRSYLEEHGVVKRIDRLHTRMLKFRRAMQVGFEGDVTFGLMQPDDRIRGQVNALASFAFYAGVGTKTTMGMGQCRRKEREEI